MKKSMIAIAATALCGAVFGIESGIVGYQNIDINNGYQFFTVTFENMDTTATTFNLSDIKVKKADGSDWTRTGNANNSCNGAIYVRKVSSNGAYGQQYRYYGKNASDEVGPGWYVGAREADGSNIVTGNAVTLNPGEGLIVYSGKNDNATKFLISGNVKLTAMSCSLANGYSFGGNCTPATLSLSDIQCTKADGSAWTRTGNANNSCNGVIYLRKISANGAYGQQYRYYGKNASDEVGPGWYVGTREADGSNLVTGDAVTFAPGEGWIMYSGKADDAAKIVIPSAVQ